MLMKTDYYKWWAFLDIDIAQVCLLDIYEPALESGVAKLSFH